MRRRADEIVVVLGGATGGRPHHRIGDRYQDLKDLGHDVDNPAGGVISAISAQSTPEKVRAFCCCTAWACVPEPGARR